MNATEHTICCKLRLAKNLINQASQNLRTLNRWSNDAGYLQNAYRPINEIIERLNKPS